MNDESNRNQIKNSPDLTITHHSVTESFKYWVNG